jgi:hypothetical protein
VIMSALDKEGLLNVDTVENTIVTDPSYDIRYLLGFLNCKLVSWFAYLFVFNKAVRTMDLDDYYVCKLPLYPSEEQKSIIEIVDKLIIAAEQLISLKEKADIGIFVNQHPRVKDKRLEYYYRRVPTESRQVLIESNAKGNLKGVHTAEEGNDIVIRIDYKSETDEVKDFVALKLRVDDKSLRQYLIHTIASNQKLGTGNILRRILAIPIPCFNNEEKMNLKAIREIMNDFLPVAQRNHLLRADVADLENRLNQEIYSFYDLDSEEINLIESATTKESTILSLLD